MTLPAAGTALIPTHVDNKENNVVLPHFVTPDKANMPTITIPDFLEVLSAMHFARLVPAPIEDASGLMLVAPSGSLKSTLLMHLSRTYAASCIAESNWHYGKLLNMRGSFYNLTIRSIVVPELSAIYAGDPRTAGRMEAMFQQLAGEGCISTNEKDSRYERYEMRASVFGAMTPEFAGRHHKPWEEGFHRRFLWAHMAMENEEVLMDYLTAGTQADLTVQSIVEPSGRYIPDLLTYSEKIFVRDLLTAQKWFGPNHTRFMFFCRAAAVLKWHYQRIKSKKDWKQTIKRFSVCLGEHAALLIVPNEPTALAHRRKRELEELRIQAGKSPRKKKTKKQGTRKLKKFPPTK